jgi:hypothetical protein
MRRPFSASANCFQQVLPKSSYCTLLDALTGDFARAEDKGLRKRVVPFAF